MRYGFVGSFGGAAQVLALAEQTEAHGWDGFFTWDGRHHAVTDLQIGPLGATYGVVASDASPDHRAATAAHVETFRDAGATWWVEARWDPGPATPRALLDRVRQGPPVG